MMPSLKSLKFLKKLGGFKNLTRPPKIKMSAGDDLSGLALKAFSLGKSLYKQRWVGTNVSSPSTGS
jgi:hypothetical protein